MTRPEPGRARSAGATSDRAAAERAAGAAAPRSLVAAGDHWVSAPLVRQAIGAWAYAAAAPERRPSEGAVRDAVGVACALHETARAVAGSPWGAQGASGEADASRVPLDVAALAERAGLEPGAVSAAVELLERSGVASRHSDATGATLALASGVLAPQPAVARLGWAEIRRRLRDAAGSLAPAQAVLRELAGAVGALADGDAAPPVRLSVRDLEERTGYGRSTVAEALGALERARVLDAESRAGRTARFTLRRAAFGLADEPPRTASAGPAAPLPAVRSTGAAAWPPAPATVAPPGTSGAAPGLAPGLAPVLLGSFAGTPIYGPPGTPLVVEQDAAGRWTCRVGPFLTLGPVSAG